jgi:hypothetical protein
MASKIELITVYEKLPNRKERLHGSCENPGRVVESAALHSVVNISIAVGRGNLVRRRTSTIDCIGRTVTFPLSVTVQRGISQQCEKHRFHAGDRCALEGTLGPVQSHI